MRETWNTTFLISPIPLISFCICLLNYPTYVEYCAASNIFFIQVEIVLSVLNNKI